jgi:hypothetical protein
MKTRLLLIVLAICAVGLSACSSARHAHLITHQSTSTPGSTTPDPPPPLVCGISAGGRCPGPEPVHQALLSDLLLSKDGHTLHGLFLCGGRLMVTEKARRVVLTYIGSHVRPGGMSCAMIRLSVHLTGALGSRAVIDGVTGKHLHIGTRAGLLLKA